MKRDERNRRGKRDNRRAHRGRRRDRRRLADRGDRGRPRREREVHNKVVGDWEIDLIYGLKTFHQLKQLIRLSSIMIQSANQESGP